MSREAHVLSTCAVNQLSTSYAVPLSPGFLFFPKGFSEFLSKWRPTFHFERPSFRDNMLVPLTENKWSGEEGLDKNYLL